MLCKNLDAEPYRTLLLLHSRTVMSLLHRRWVDLVMIRYQPVDLRTMTR